jgi:MinD-like ATPase involved in chromosome partitioning or flagellar assembly
MNREEAASMATIISIAINLAFLLEKRGKRVAFANLDVEGSDIHICSD